MNPFLRQMSSFAAPFLICVVFPYWLVSDRMARSGGTLFNPALLLALLGAIIALVGLALFIQAVRMIILIGRGTIMPWDPTRHLVTGSLYAYVRNPMILGVILIEAGEAFLFNSFWLGLIAVLFFGFNTVYFIYSEEPGLEKRFGQEYVEYKQNVPRWIPRMKPWRPE